MYNNNNIPQIIKYVSKCIEEAKLNYYYCFVLYYSCQVDYFYSEVEIIFSLLGSLIQLLHMKDAYQMASLLNFPLPRRMAPVDWESKIVSGLHT